MQTLLSQQTVTGVGTGAIQFALNARANRILLIFSCDAGGPCNIYTGDNDGHQFFAQCFPTEPPLRISLHDAPGLVEQGIVILQHPFCPWYVTEIWQDCLPDPCDQGN